MVNIGNNNMRYAAVGDNFSDYGYLGSRLVYDNTGIEAETSCPMPIKIKYGYSSNAFVGLFFTHLDAGRYLFNCMHDDCEGEGGSSAYDVQFYGDSVRYRFDGLGNHDLFTFDDDVDDVLIVDTDNYEAHWDYISGGTIDHLMDQRPKGLYVNFFGYPTEMCSKVLSISDDWYAKANETVKYLYYGPHTSSYYEQVYPCIGFNTLVRKLPNLTHIACMTDVSDYSYFNFQGHSHISTLYLPETTAIKSNFVSGSTLSKIYIPKVTTLKDNALANARLNLVRLKDVNYIGSNVFNGNTASTITIEYLGSAQDWANVAKEPDWRGNAVVNVVFLN